MIQDARRIQDGGELEADLAIVGAGAAGVAIARALMGRGLRIVLIESGGEGPEPRTQQLCDADLVGQPYPYFDHARLRCLGGSTGHWDGGCVLLDPDDLEARAWLPWSGWPLRYDELLPWYEQAQALCGLDGLAAFAAGPTDPRPLDLDPGRLESRLWQFRPTRFGDIARDCFTRDGDVAVLLHATVVGLEANAYGSTVTRLRVATLAGNRFSVRAQAFVLAGGGLENPRLLLQANARGPALGTAAASVGRFFMEHLAVMTAQVRVRSPEIWRFYDLFSGRDAKRRGFFCLAPAVRRSARLLHAAWRVDSVGLGHRQAVRRLLRSAGRSGRFAALARDLGLVVGGPGDLLREAWRPLNAERSHRMSHKFVLWGVFEQAPNPESRVQLGLEVDPLGQPRLEIDWRLSEVDLQSIRQATRVLAATLTDAGAGRIETFSWSRDDSQTPAIEPTFHHMGTTRMSEGPETGVVDADGRVHGVANLFVAGSSVFPTGGWANPTLTIVALALRLARHLERELARPVASPIAAPGGIPHARTA